jgi:hypothetical protein
LLGRSYQVAIGFVLCGGEFSKRYDLEFGNLPNKNSETLFNTDRNVHNFCLVQVLKLQLVLFCAVLSFSDDLLLKYLKFQNLLAIILKTSCHNFCKVQARAQKLEEKQKKKLRVSWF